MIRRPPRSPLFPSTTLSRSRRQHLINVFLWPGARGPAAVASTRTRQGYHLLHWATADYTYWVASDLGLTELGDRSEEHTSELQSRLHLVCRLLLEKKKTRQI